MTKERRHEDYIEIVFNDPLHCFQIAGFNKMF